MTFVFFIYLLVTFGAASVLMPAPILSVFVSMYLCMRVCFFVRLELFFIYIFLKIERHINTVIIIIFMKDW